MKLLLAVLLFAAVPTGAAEIYTFGVLPNDGQIEGAPGQTVGWGYFIENQSTSHWLVAIGLAPGSFGFGTPALFFDFPILAPNSSVTVPFDATAMTGLLAVTWDAAAPIGTVESGTFLLEAEWWDGDPLADGQFVSFADPLNQPYSAAVVPEPGTGIAMGLGLAVTAVLGVRRRQRLSR